MKQLRLISLFLLSVLLTVVLGASIAAAEAGNTEKPSYEELEAELAEKTAAIEELEATIAGLEHQIAVRDWVAEFDGGHVEAKDARDQYSYLEYIYSMYGLSIDAATEVQMKQDIVETLLQTEVENYKAAQLGFTEVDADTEAELRADAAESWDSYLEDCKANLEDQADNEEDLVRLATEYLAGYGISEESLYQDSLNELAREQLSESITSQVEITEDGLRALFEEKVAEDQATFSADPGRYGSTVLYGGECYWIPEGYRTVKQVLIKFDEDQSARYSEYTGIIDDLEAELAALDAPAEEDTAEETDDETEEAPRTAEEINAELESARADLDALYAELTPAAEEVTALIDSGADFDGLVATYGGDPGSVNDDGTVNTYTVSADSEGFDPAFVKAAMSTAAIGDVSAPEKGMYGYYIVRYDGDVTPGPVDFETVRDALSEETLSDLQDEAYESQLAAWYEELNVVYYLNNF